MKRLLCAAAGIAMIVPGSAGAQMQNQTQQRPGMTRPAPGQHHNRPNRPTPGQQPGRPSIQPVGPPQQGHRPGRPSIQPVRPPHQRPPAGRPPQQVRPPTYHPGHRPPSFRPIHRPSFQYPRGWHYRRWHVGLVLPRIFLVRTYYFYDYYDLGLGPPPPGYVWVRYGPDLLLVNIHTGRIADVIYGAFY